MLKKDLNTYRNYMAMVSADRGHRADELQAHVLALVFQRRTALNEAYDILKPQLIRTPGLEQELEAYYDMHMARLLQGPLLPAPALISAVAAQFLQNYATVIRTAEDSAPRRAPRKQKTQRRKKSS